MTILVGAFIMITMYRLHEPYENSDCKNGTLENILFQLWKCMHGMDNVAPCMESNGHMLMILFCYFGESS